VTALLAAIFVAGATAATVAPDPSRMALMSADFQQAQLIASHRDGPSGGASTGYARFFRNVRYANTRLSILINEVFVFKSLPSARKSFDQVASVGEILNALLAIATKSAHETKPLVFRERRPSVGDGAFDLLLSSSNHGKTTQAGFDAVRIGRVVSFSAYKSAGPTGLRGPATVALLTTMANRITMQLTPAPANATPPEITGDVAQGEVLTVHPGTWTPGSTFTYHWERCNAGGAQCAPIPGATGETYSITFDDIASTIAVAVTATNRGGATTVESAATAVVGG
jgi:hypothetical protein